MAFMKVIYPNICEILQILQGNLRLLNNVFMNFEFHGFVKDED
jgi:hypothetical protein